MKQTYRCACHEGFTLIEMLLVILVIAIMALIIIPRVSEATRRSKESALSANLVQLRKAIAQFNTDTGAYPYVLEDIVATDRAELVSGNPDQVVQLYQGPYLTPSAGIPGYAGLPVNPMLDPTDANVTDHWYYDNTTGTVSSAVIGVTLDGISYGSL